MWQKKILGWYYINKRTLPWRLKKNQNFYRIWISEVMLQQTQVSVVIPYYKKFITKWPTLELFYKAELEEILKIWQGMGYYKRAQNLFKAKELLKNRQEKIVISSNDLKKLPGVGDYISCAISAILKDEPCAVIDGNIKRVLIRVFGLKNNDKLIKKQVKEISKKLTPLSENGNYCQSLMDLANLVCKAKKPNCQICPVFYVCQTKGKFESKKTIKKICKKISVAFYTYNKDSILIDKTNNNLLQSLYCFPLSDFRENKENFIEEDFLNKTVNDWMSKNNLQIPYQYIGEIVHKFSHFQLKVLIVNIRLKNKFKFKNYKWLKKIELSEKPVSSLMLKIMKKVEC